MPISEDKYKYDKEIIITTSFIIITTIFGYLIYKVLF